MNEPKTELITGKTTLTLGDDLSLVRPRVITVLTLLLSMQVAFCVFYYSVSGIAPIWSDPGQAVYLTLRDGGWQMLPLLAIIALSIPLLSAMRFMRLPVQNKIVSYAVDQTGIEISDATGVSLQTPWSAVKRANRTQRHLVMNMQAGGKYFAPWRAFSPADAERLWSLVQLKTRTR